MVTFALLRYATLYLTTLHYAGPYSARRHFEKLGETTLLWIAVLDCALPDYA